MQDMLWRGVAYIQAGERAEGKHLLTLVVQLEPDNAVAWLWLASVAGSEDERLAALQRVVEINPNDAAGRHAQTLLRRDVIREVAGRIPPSAPPREVPRARPALPPPTPPAPVARAPVPVPAERPRASRGVVVLLLAGVIAACMGIVLLGSTLLLYGGGDEQATPTRVIIERTRAPATPRSPTQPPVPSPTLAPRRPRRARRTPALARAGATRPWPISQPSSAWTANRAIPSVGAKRGASPPPIPGSPSSGPATEPSKSASRARTPGIWCSRCRMVCK